MDIDISELGLGGLDLLTALHGQCFSTPDGPGDQAWDRGSMAEILALPGVFALVGDGPLSGPVGFAICHQMADECELLSMGVLPPRTGQGVGGQLLRACLALAARRGGRRFFLEVASDNGRAAALYRRAGLSEAGRRASYYKRARGRVDALIMSRILKGCLPGGLKI